MLTLWGGQADFVAIMGSAGRWPPPPSLERNLDGRNMGGREEPLSPDVARVYKAVMLHKQAHWLLKCSQKWATMLSCAAALRGW